MPWYQTIVLGAVQGITEFLPVSSSGHLLLPQMLLQWQAQGIFFDVAVHIATLLAVIIYFRKKLWSLMKAAVSSTPSTEKTLAWYVLVWSVVPVGIIGLFESNIGFIRETPLIIGISFIVWGVVLAIADQYQKNKQTREVQETSRKDILWMSLAQVIALIPGTSRSGITMTAGLFSGLSRRAAAEISFFMAIPVIFAAGAKQLYDIVGSAITIDWGMIALGSVTAFVSAMIGIWFLLRLVERAGYIPFAVYRIVIGIVIIFFAL